MVQMQHEMPRWVPDAVIRGVWGPNSPHNNHFYGGAECAAQSSPTYKLTVNLLLLPFYVFAIKAYHKHAASGYQTRKANLLLNRNTKPSLIEYIVALISICNLVVLAYYKAQSESMIFMLNPCHVISVLLIYVCFSEFSQKSELAAVWMFAQAYGAWLGLLITENDGLP